MKKKQPHRVLSPRRAARLYLLQNFYARRLGAPMEDTTENTENSTGRQAVLRDDDGEDSRLIANIDETLAEQIETAFAAKEPRLNAAIETALEARKRQGGLAALDVILQLILLIAAAELSLGKDDPPLIIREYCALTDLFYEEGNAVSLINAVLDRVARLLCPGRFPPPSEEPS